MTEIADPTAPPLCRIAGTVGSDGLVHCAAFDVDVSISRRPQLDLADALRWVIEHKSCTGFSVCWEAAPTRIKTTILAAWGDDPWPLP